MAMIEIKELQKKYGMEDAEVTALDQVSMTIEEGEFVSIMGASGSGKSTLLNLTGGLDFPTSGEVLFDGKNIFDLNDTELSAFRLKNIGFVFQAYNLLPELTVRDNILLPFSLLGEKGKEELLFDVAERFGLSDRLAHLPSQLSGGQQQRAAVARAVIHKPRLLLCDEPTGNLDKKAGEAIIRFLQEVNEEGITIVMITHDGELAARTKRTVFLSDGKLL